MTATEVRARQRVVHRDTYCVPEAVYALSPAKIREAQRIMEVAMEHSLADTFLGRTTQGPTPVFRVKRRRLQQKFQVGRRIEWRDIPAVADDAPDVED